MKETKSKKQKTSPNSEYDFSKKNLEHCMNTILTYLKSVKLTEKANVIEQTYYKHSDKVANLLNDVLEGKKNDRNIISPEEAAALQVYLNMSKSTYQSLKNFADNKGVHFFPTWKKTREEREKCLAAGVESDDIEVSASIKATLKNWLDRAMQDPEIKEPVERLKKIHGNNIKFKLIYKLGKNMGIK